MPATRIDDSDEIITMIARGYTPAAIANCYNRSRRIAAYRRFNVPGSGTLIKLLAEAVRHGLCLPDSDHDIEGLTPLRRAVDRLVYGEVTIEHSTLRIVQALINGLSQEYIGAHPRLFSNDDEAKPIHQNAVSSRCHTACRRLGLQSIEQLALATLWAGETKLPQAPVIKMESDEQQLLLLSIEGLQRDEIAASLKMSTSSIQLMRAQVCAKLRVADLAQAVIVAVDRKLIRLPDWMEEITNPSLDDEPKAALIGYIKKYIGHILTRRPGFISKHQELSQALLQLCAPNLMAAIAVATRAGLIPVNKLIVAPPPPKFVSLSALAAKLDVIKAIVEFGDVTFVITGPPGPAAMVSLDEEEQEAQPAANLATAPSIAAEFEPHAAEAEPETPGPVGPEPSGAVRCTRQPVVVNDQVLTALASATVYSRGSYVFDEITESLISKRHLPHLIAAVRSGALRSPDGLAQHLAVLRSSGLSERTGAIAQDYANGMTLQELARRHDFPGDGVMRRLSDLNRRFRARRVPTVILLALWAGIIE